MCLEPECTNNLIDLNLKCLQLICTEYFKTVFILKHAEAFQIPHRLKLVCQLLELCSAVAFFRFVGLWPLVLCEYYTA